MINKKAFTLIEILAVIVLLAIVFLISVPLITGVLESAKLSAFENSLNNIFNEVSIYTATDDNQTIPEDGLDIDVLNLKGNLISGSIILNEESIVEIVNVSDGKYCGSGTIHNYIIYKGSCDSNIMSAPTVVVNNTSYDSTASYTISNLVTTNGIEGFEYYFSATSTVPSKSVTASGISTESEVIINEASKYVFFRVVKTSSLKSPWTNAFINYVDLTAPTSSLVTSIVTSNSIMLAATCNDVQSGITKYEFSKDNGTTYIDNLTGNVYTFNNLSSNTYSFKVRCTNGASMTSASSISASTVSIDAPTYSISPSGYATSKTLTINYPSGYTNEYSLDSGTTWITYTAPIVFNANGSVIARVNDGTNYVTGSSYTITNIDTTNPTVTTSVTGKVGTLTLSDNLGLSGYAVTTSTDIPSSWTSITGTSSSQSYTGTVAGTYYAWVRDQANNTAYSSFVLPTTAFCAYATGYEWDFQYTGSVQDFVIPCNGAYKVELWGASGGTGYSTYLTTALSYGGKGSYTSGTINLSQNMSLYIYVGSRGTDDTTSAQGLGSIAGGYNGGGSGRSWYNGNSYVHNAAGGGGATDVRLVNGLWNNLASLRSRIMVAAGGGGAGGHEGNATGGYAGGLSGYQGKNPSGYWDTQSGATQISGGIAQSANGAIGESGSFGIGGSSATVSGGGGGGSGYYGGAGGTWGPGSGGSSFISGYSGCNAINSSGVHTSQAVHYSNYSFSSASMIAGNATMNSPTGVSETGHTGNGYATITLISIVN